MIGHHIQISYRCQPA